VTLEHDAFEKRYSVARIRKDVRWEDIVHDYFATGTLVKKKERKESQQLCSLLGAE